MRTLLNQSCPPEYTSLQNFSAAAETAPETARTFPLAAVLASKDDLVEVGVDGTVIATPGASAEMTGGAPERGVASFSPGHSWPDDFSFGARSFSEATNSSEVL